MSDVDGRDPRTGQFLKGYGGGPGRQKGSKVKLAEIFLKDLLKAWSEKGKEAIDAMIVKSPGDFVKVVASLVPKDFVIDQLQFDDMDDEDLSEFLVELRSAIGSSRRKIAGDRSAASDEEDGKAQP